MVRDEPFSNSGFALVAVLAFLMVFAVFLAPFTTASRIRAFTTSNRFETLRLDLAAESITEMIAVKMTKDPPFKTRLMETSRIAPQTCTIAGMVLSVQVLDQASLIDLNKATADLISVGLQSVGFDTISAKKTAHAMAAFRSVQTTDREVWDGTMPPNGLKHGPFEDLSELHEFAPLQLVPLERLARVFTLFNPSGTISSRSIEPVLAHYAGANRSIASRSIAPSLEVLSVATNLIKRRVKGNDYRIIEVDNLKKRFRRQSSPRTPPAANSNGEVAPCASTIGPDISAFVQESFRQ